MLSETKRGNRFIRTRILAARSHQLFLGASAFVKLDRLLNNLTVAKQELLLNKCPVHPADQTNEI